MNKQKQKTEAYRGAHSSCLWLVESAHSQPDSELEAVGRAGIAIDLLTVHLEESISLAEPHCAVIKWKLVSYDCADSRAAASTGHYPQTHVSCICPNDPAHKGHSYLLDSN